MGYEKYWYTKYLYRCVNRGIDFEYSEEEFLKVVKKPCFYCGKPPEERFIKGKSNPYSRIVVNGVDRVDPNLGYIENNCVTCCSTCNRMKSNIPLEEFLLQVIMIHKNLTQNLHKFRIVDILESE